MVTIFKNIYSEDPHYISIDKALDRIRNGASKEKINFLRSVIDKDRQDTLKRDLPSVCFSGKFSKRKDDFLVEHSGFLVLDFDDVIDVDSKKEEISRNEYIYSCWASPRNNGVKALIKIADTGKHREHFGAIRDIFPEIDKSGVNVSRVCYESYDPGIYINKNCKVFDKVKVEYEVHSSKVVDDERVIFENINRWLTNRGDAFVSGERNHFIFKLASACCRFGLSEQSCEVNCINHYSIGMDGFSVSECKNAIKSAYKSNKHYFGTAKFENGDLVDIQTKLEVVVTQEMLDDNIKPKDVVYSGDVKAEGMSIFDRGYEKVNGIGVHDIDKLFKLKEGEISLITGYGNYGKSTFKAWMLLMRALKYGEKFAFFSPENRSEDFYFDMVEMLLACDCSPKNKQRPNRDMFEAAWDWIGKYFFYVYPKEMSPTPAYVKERFLELIIKEKVKGIVVDPFNQLDNDYKSTNGARDKYLEAFLADFSRFSRQNSVYGIITAHPKSPKGLEKDGNYRCPDVYDVADGAMWNNKMDNILVYHRPERQSDPQSDSCEFHSKKIRRQKVVGYLGTSSFRYNRKIRRFIFNGQDPMDKLLIENSFPFSRNPGIQTNIYSDLPEVESSETEISELPF